MHVFAGKLAFLKALMFIIREYISDTFKVFDHLLAWLVVVVFTAHLKLDKSAANKWIIKKSRQKSSDNEARN